MEIALEILFSPRLQALLEEGKPDGVRARMLPVHMRRDFDFTPVAIIIMELSKDVSVEIFIDWLLAKIPQKARKTITIDRTEINWDKGELTRIIQEKMKIEE